MKHLRLINDEVRPLGPGHAAADSDAELLDAYSCAVVSAVDQVSPSVVAIQVQQGNRGGGGSGVLITPDGYLLTNHHVVHGAESIEVVLHGGRSVCADIIGLDEATDLALLRVRATGLPFSRLGRTQPVRVGQLVVAIGNPLGFSETVSAGIVSAKGRALRARDGQLIENVLQHTAPLNPGNSGGPLVTSDHAVIGINTAIIAMAQGIGFAVPADTADWVVSEVLNHGRVRRAQLGVRVRTRVMTARERRAYGANQPSAVEVVSVEPDSAAARAGLRVHDLVLAANGDTVLTVEQLLRRLSGPEGLSVLALSVGRRGRLLSIELFPNHRPAA